MEKKTSNNFSTNTEKFKEFLLKKATSFFNKKRITIKDNSDLENFELLNSNNCEFNILNDFFNGLFTNKRCFNNLELSSAEKLSILPEDKNKNIDSINETVINSINTLKNDENNNISKISEINNSNSFVNSKAEDILTRNTNDAKTMHTTMDNINTIIKIEKSEENYMINKSIKLNENEEENKLNINEGISKVKSNNKIEDTKYQRKNSNSHFGFSKKDEVCCFALDLLKKNGHFQIRLNKDNDNVYLLRINKVEIKDDYYEQIDYARKYGKYSSLKNTAPNNKFWLQRYYYYSKFDKGIMMDRESWYSVTPEKIAKYLAKLIRGKSVIDGFCGSGGNVIQFSKYCSKVYSIDISEKKLSICKNNCKVYHCENNIEFFHSDFLKMKNKIKADYIFLSPPWGGMEYKNSYVYSIKKFMTPDINEIVRVSLSVADNILFFLPRNLDLDELFNICSSIKNETEKNSGKKLFFDIQILESNKRIKSLLIIFGHNINEIFKKNDLENYLYKHYKNIEGKSVDFLYSFIQKEGCFAFFKEENYYRTKQYKGNNLLDLVDFFKAK